VECGGEPAFQPIEIDLDGRIDIGKGGGIRNTFETAPDAPVTKFTRRWRRRADMNG
jgi:hypothetical protein